MTELELRAHRIEAIGAIENLMSLHAYYHAADQNREELLNCWSKTRGDEIIWSQNFGRWQGMHKLMPMYAGDNKYTDAEWLKSKIIKAHPEMDFYPRTFIFGAKAAAGYRNAKLTIKLINSVADVINNDPVVDGRIKVVFIENYRVSNAEWIFAAADVSEQISTASKEASGTGNMKFMLNGALTLGTMDGANVEIVEEVGKENAFIFGLSAEQVIQYENYGGYNPMDIFNNDQDIRRVLMQLINGTYSPQDSELFRPLYNSLLNTQDTAKADTYFILADFKSYAEAQRRVEAAYKDEKNWAKSALLNVACAGKFSSDRTIEEYERDIWHQEKVILPSKPELSK